MCCTTAQPVPTVGTTLHANVGPRQLSSSGLLRVREHSLLWRLQHDIRRQSMLGRTLRRSTQICLHRRLPWRPTTGRANAEEVKRTLP